MEAYVGIEQVLKSLLVKCCKNIFLYGRIAVRDYLTFKFQDAIFNVCVVV